jgi:hypothetical protein
MGNGCAGFKGRGVSTLEKSASYVGEETVPEPFHPGTGLRQTSPEKGRPRAVSVIGRQKTVGFRFDSFCRADSWAPFSG